MSINPKAGLVCFEEAMELVRSTDDPVTRRLLHRANFFVMKRALAEKQAPHADFDMLFFMQVMREFLGHAEHGHLQRILEGEDLGVDDEML